MLASLLTVRSVTSGTETASHRLSVEITAGEIVRGVSMTFEQFQKEQGMFSAEFLHLPV